MTRELLNTLYIQTEDAYAHLADETVKVRVDQEVILRVPLHHLGSIFAFGNVSISSPLMMKCAEDGRSVVFFDHGGRFKARVTGKTAGNVLLRKAQWETMGNSKATLDIAKCIIAGKLQNSRQVLMRGAREAKSETDKADLTSICEELAQGLSKLSEMRDIDQLRGQEGIAAQAYFSVFDRLLTGPSTEFAFAMRSRRPPRDRMNALLSFVYSLATSDCVSALEGVGLDPQVGFLHVLRPGRPALALDLIEEFRAIILDRLCLSIVNRKQLSSSDFEEREGGSCLLNRDGRKKVLTAYATRKKEEVRHELFKEKIPVGMLFHIQARILARTLRGDIPLYRPFMPQ